MSNPYEFFMQASSRNDANDCYSVRLYVVIKR